MGIIETLVKLYEDVNNFMKSVGRNIHGDPVTEICILLTLLIGPPVLFSIFYLIATILERMSQD